MVTLFIVLLLFYLDPLPPTLRPDELCIGDPELILPLLLPPLPTDDLPLELPGE